MILREKIHYPWHIKDIEDGTWHIKDIATLHIKDTILTFVNIVLAKNSLKSRCAVACVFANSVVAGGPIQTW